MTHRRRIFMVIILIIISLLMITSCETNEVVDDSTEVEVFVPTIVLSTQTSSPTITATATVPVLPTYTPILTNTPTQEFIEPENCQKPQENYDLVEINGSYINQRTYSMLEHAQSIYGGEIELTGYHLTQGSYTNQISASFGTHNGGAAVDISVIQYGIYQVLYDDIEPLIQALRIAGFAAWLRNFDQIYPGSPIHIHAIAIGDRDLSGPAEDQLTGEFGYFRGFNGIPQENGSDPIPDEHGGPNLCQWMLEMGYSDLRNSSP